MNLDEHCVSTALEFLCTDELARASRTSRTWREAAQGEHLWRGRLLLDWDADAAPDQPARLQWLAKQREFGRYRPLWAPLHRAVGDLVGWLRVHFADAAATLRPGTTESALDAAEQDLGVRLCGLANQSPAAPSGPSPHPPLPSRAGPLSHSPEELRCALRIHDGQLTSVDDAVDGGDQRIAFVPSIFHGVFGGYAFYDFLAVVRWLPLRRVVMWTRRMREHRPSLVCGDDGQLSHVIAGMSFNLTRFLLVDLRTGAVSVNASTEPVHRPALCGDTAEAAFPLQPGGYGRWLQRFAGELTLGRRAIVPFFEGMGDPTRGLSLFRRCGPCVCAAVTRGVVVEVSTIYCPELSPPSRKHLWAYRIRLRLANDHGQPWQRCQLTARKWTIEKEGGPSETVKGAAVVGRFPALLPNPDVVLGEAGAAQSETVAMTDELRQIVSLEQASRDASAMAQMQRQEGEEPPAEFGTQDFAYVSCTMEDGRAAMSGVFTFVPGSVWEPQGPEFAVVCPRFELDVPQFIG